MADRIVRFLGRFELFSQEEGGRSQAVFGSEYRPNHNLTGDMTNGLTMGFIPLKEGDIWRPGEAREAEIDMLLWPEYIELTEGFTWPIQEASRVVGRGTVLRIISDTLRA